MCQVGPGWVLGASPSLPHHHQHGCAYCQPCWLRAANQGSLMVSAHRRCMRLDRSLWSWREIICDQAEMTKSPRQHILTQLEPPLLSFSTDMFSYLPFLQHRPPNRGKLFGLTPSDARKCGSEFLRSPVCGELDWRRGLAGGRSAPERCRCSQPWGSLQPTKEAFPLSSLFLSFFNKEILVYLVGIGPGLNTVLEATCTDVTYSES